MDAILTVRLDKDLKMRASQIMEKEGLTPSQAVRKLFEDTVKNDALPFQEERHEGRDLASRVRAFDACRAAEPIDMTDEELRAERFAERHGSDA